MRRSGRQRLIARLFGEGGKRTLAASPRKNQGWRTAKLFWPVACDLLYVPKRDFGLDMSRPFARGRCAPSCALSVGFHVTRGH
jgi:hypothetical protein